jgi:NCAIR mutase (PurE)-related protein
MDRSEVEALLRDVAAGSVAVEAAVETLAAGPMNGSVDLGFARVDTHRGLRTGDPEVVFAAGKSADQTVAILTELARQDGGRPALATRLPDDALVAVRQAFPDASVDDVARAVAVGPLPEGRGTVCVVAAGTSDAPVAAEAAFVARAFGATVDRVDDVGVAGIHRLMAVRDRLDSADCLVVVAGMEGALPSVVGGLTGVPLVAVPPRSATAPRTAVWPPCWRCSTRAHPASSCATSTTASGPGCSRPGSPGGRPSGHPRDGRLARRVRRRERRHAARGAGRCRSRSGGTAGSRRRPRHRSRCG